MRTSAWKLFKRRVNKAKYALFECAQLLDFGYTTEHFRVALQFAAVCTLGAMCMVVDSIRNFFTVSPLWIFIIISVIMEPLVGKALKKGLLTAFGIILGGGIGSGVAAAWEAICFDRIHQNGFGPCGKGLTSTAVILGGFGLMLNMMRFPEYADSFKIALIIYFACVYFPELRPLPKGLISFHVEPMNSSYFVFKAKVVIGALLGVGFMTLASLLVFPNTAQSRIKRQLEHILERLGNITFRALGEFVEDPDAEGKIPGTTATDEQQLFRDDGLATKYEGLKTQLQLVGSEVFQATELLPSAKAEHHVISRWWKARYSVKAYDFVLKCAVDLVNSLMSLLTTMSDGSMRLGLCTRYKDLIEDVRQDVTSVFSALAGLIHGSASEEYVAEKFRNMADSLVELYHGVNAVNPNGFDSDLETFAIFTKSAINLARQAALMFRELSPMKGRSMHAYIAASFNHAHDDYHCHGQASVSRSGSLARMERSLSKATTMGDFFHRSGSHRFANFMLDRVKSFHAEDNPFEMCREEGGQYIPRSWSLASLQSTSDNGQQEPGQQQPHELPGGSASKPAGQPGFAASREHSRQYISRANKEAFAGSLERVEEESENLARASSDAERLLTAIGERQKRRDHEDDDALIQQLGDDQGWDNATIRQHLLGQLMPRRASESIEPWDPDLHRERLHLDEQSGKPGELIRYGTLDNSALMSREAAAQTTGDAENGTSDEIAASNGEETNGGSQQQKASNTQPTLQRMSLTKAKSFNGYRTGAEKSLKAASPESEEGEQARLLPGPASIGNSKGSDLPTLKPIKTKSTKKAADSKAPTGHKSEGRREKRAASDPRAGPAEPTPLKAPNKTASDIDYSSYWKHLTEIDPETLFVPVSPLKYVDDAEREQSLGESFASAEARSTSPAPNEWSRANGSRNAGLDQPTARTAPTRHSDVGPDWTAHPSRLMSRNSRRNVRDMVMKEAKIHDWPNMPSQAPDANLRKWLRSAQEADSDELNLQSNGNDCPQQHAVEQQVSNNLQNNGRMHSKSLDCPPAAPGPYTFRETAEQLQPSEPSRQASPLEELDSPPAEIEPELWDPDVESAAAGGSLLKSIPEKKLAQRAAIGIINKEVWNLEEEEPQTQPVTTGETDMGLSEPNLDFVAVKINDWNDDKDGKGRARRWSDAGIKRSRGADETLDKAKHSVLDAARGFWEAHLKLRNG